MKIKQLACVMLLAFGLTANAANTVTKVNQVSTAVTLSVSQFSRSVVSDSLQPHESQHARLPCPSLTPGVHPNSRPSSQ